MHRLNPQLKLGSLLALLLLVMSSTLQAQEAKHYDELTYPKLGKIEKPDITTFTTDNGIQFFLLEDHELPLVDVSVKIRTGGVQIPNDKAGLSSLTGTVIRSGGTEDIPSDSLNKLLEDHATSMETGISFSSGSAGMNVLKEDFNQMLPVFIDLLKNPAFPQDKIELAKKQRKTSISRRNENQQQIAFREFDRLIYGRDSRYGRLTEYETINNIKREDLVKFHDQNFVGNKMLVGVVGDFDVKSMKKKLTDAFNSIPAGPDNASLDFPKVDYQYPSTINIIDKPDVNQSMVLMGHIGGKRPNDDYAAIQVMNQVLSGGFSGRLMQKVRTDMGLAYSVFGQYGFNAFYPGVFYTGVMTKSSTTAEAIDAIIEQVKRLQEEPVTQKELDDTRDQILNSLVFNYDSRDKILAERMSNAYRGLPADAFEQYIDEVKKIKPADIQRVAQKYLHPDQLQILVVGNKDEIGDQLDKYGKVNEIDITIPQPGNESEEAQVKGDAKEGKKLLGQMSKALIKSGTHLDSLTVDATMTQYNPNMPQGKMQMDMTSTIKYPDEVETTLQTPQGKIAVVLEDGKAYRKMMGQKQPMPQAMAKQMRAEISRSFLSIARRADTLSAEFMGNEQLNGNSYQKLRINLDPKVTMLLDPDTHLPHYLRYQQFNPQQGKQMKIESRLNDWKVKEGVAYPYDQKTFSDGDKRSETTVKDHKVNG